MILNIENKIYPLRSTLQSIHKSNPHIQTPRQFQAPHLQLPRIDLLDHRIGRQDQRRAVLLPPAFIFQLDKRQYADEIFALFISMPLLDPFKLFFGDVFPLVKAQVYAYIEIAGKLMRTVVVKLFVLVFVLIAQG